MGEWRNSGAKEPVKNVTETRHSLLRATTLMLCGNMSMVLLQAAQFVLLARLLGATEFGRVAAINALLTISIPLADLGFGNLLQLRCARDRQLAPREFGVAAGVTLVSGLLIGSLLLLIAPLIYGERSNAYLVVCLGLAELVGFRLVTVSGQLHAAFDRFGTASAFNALISLCRVVSLGIIILLPVYSAQGWATGVAILSIVLAIFAVAKSIRVAGGFEFSLAHAVASVREAIPFALGTTARGTYSDMDKVLLGRYGTAVELGSYTSAYRLVSMAFMPIRSLLQASFGRFSRAGVTGIGSTIAFSKRLLLLALPYAICASLGLYFSASLLPLLLGESFRPAVEMLQMLAVLPVIQTFHFIHSDALTGAGYQSLRMRIQFFVVGFYCVVGFVLIPQHGWIGAAITCISGESLLAVMITAAAYYLYKCDRVHVPRHATAVSEGRCIFRRRARQAG